MTQWSLALLKGIREPHEVKRKSFDLGGNRTHDLRIRSTVTLPTELRGRGEIVGDDLGGESVDLIRRSWVRFPPRSKSFFFTYSWVKLALQS